MKEYGRREGDKSLVDHLKTAGLIAIGIGAAYAGIKYGQQGVYKRLMSELSQSKVPQEIIKDAAARFTPNKVPITSAIGHLLEHTAPGKWFTSISKTNSPMTILEKILHLREMRYIGGKSPASKIFTQASDLPILRGLPNVDQQKSVFYALGNIYQESASGFKRIADDMFLYPISPNKPFFFQKNLAKQAGLTFDIPTLSKKIDNLKDILRAQPENADQIRSTIKALGDQIAILKKQAQYRPGIVEDPVGYIKRALSMEPTRPRGNIISETKSFIGDIRDFFKPTPGEDTILTSWGLMRRGNIQNTLLPPLKSIGQFDFRGAFNKSFLGAGGSHMSGVNSISQSIWYAFERMNRNIVRSPAGFLALPDKDVGSLYDLARNTMLKRILPMAIIYQLAAYTLFESDKLTGGHGIKTQIGNTWQSFNIGLSHIGEYTGINAILRRIQRVWPREQVGDKHLGMSPEELESYYKSGVYPIRKGRFWALSSTPFIGGRIESFDQPWSEQLKQPSRNIMIYGSEDAYWRRAWTPSIRYPFAPIERLLDPYYVERINYKKRPYPLTGPAFSPHTPWGTLLNMTIGKIIKPPRLMHTRDIGGVNISPLSIKSRSKLSPGYASAESMHSRYYLRFTTSGSNQLYTRELHAGYQGAQASVIANARVPVSKSKNSLAYGKYGTEVIGGTTIIKRDIGGTDIFTIKQPGTVIIEDESIGDEYAHFKGFVYNMPITQGEYYMSPFKGKESIPLTKEQLRPVNPFSTGYRASQMYYNWSRMIGIYGFIGSNIGQKLGIVWPYTGNRKPILQHAGNIAAAERWYYDDIAIGGIDPFGFTVSEIGRRFLTHRIKTNVEYNRIPNMMPQWLPGDEYIQNFKVGDPYAKIPRGERRLPGKLYEKIHNLDILKMTVGPSTISGTREDIYRYLTDQKYALSINVANAAERGTKVHKKIEKELIESGIAEKTEVQLYDKSRNIKGYIDAVGPNGEPIEIKTVSTQKFSEIATSRAAIEKHVRQLQLYMDYLDKEKGKILYVSRDDPKQRIELQIKRDRLMVASMYRNLQEVRGKIKKGIKEGTISRGALYPDIEKLRILGDVAPWSEKYFSMLKQLREKETVSPGQRDKIQRIEKLASARRKKYDFVNYKYDVSTTKKSVIVERVIDPVTFYAKGERYPYRLTGVKIKSSKRDEAVQYLSKIIKPGARISVEYENRRTGPESKDTYHTIRSIMSTPWIGDIGLAMVKRGLAEERTKDTPLAMKTRIDPVTRSIMHVVEKLGHRPILPPYQHKILPWDSALEYYRRNKVYAPERRLWSRPYSDYIKPTIHSFGAEGAPWSTIAGGMLGAILAQKGYRAHGAAIGATIGSLSTLFQESYRATTGRTFIPERTRKERELKEYFDKLKYVKHMRLYRKYRKQVKNKYGYDIEDKIRKIEEAGKERTKLLRELEDEKRSIVRSFGIKNDDKIDRINAKLRELRKVSGVTELSPIEAAAYMHRKKAKQTMYGADPYGALRDVMAALPRDEKPFFSEFIKASDKEREEIYKIAPDYMRRFLAPYYGLKPKKQQDLRSYFKSHFLPPEDWAGWDESKDLEGYMMQTVKSAGFDPEQFGFFPEEQIRYSQYTSLDYRRRGATPENFSGVEENVRVALESAGLTNLKYSILKVPADTSSLQVNVNVRSNRKREIQRNIGDYV